MRKGHRAGTLPSALCSERNERGTCPLPCSRSAPVGEPALCPVVRVHNAGNLPSALCPGRTAAGNLASALRLERAGAGNLTSNLCPGRAGAQDLPSALCLERTGRGTCPPPCAQSSQWQGTCPPPRAQSAPGGKLALRPVPRAHRLGNVSTAMCPECTGRETCPPPCV